MYYVYILKSLKNSRMYTGSTDNIERRFAEHNAGKSKATMYIRPLELIHCESYNTRAEAYNREMYLKTGKGRQEIKEMLAIGI